MAQGPARRQPARSAPHRGLADPRLDQFGRLAVEAGHQLAAGARGAVDGASMGLADPASAALRAAFGPGGLSNYGQNFRSNLEQAAAQDLYDAQRYGAARKIGEGVGTVGAIAGSAFIPGAQPVVAGRVLSAAAGRTAGRATRLAKPAIDHVLRTGAVAGGGAGLAGQFISDLAQVRPSPVQDYAGAIVAGGLGGLAAPFVGSAIGGSIAGGATPAMQAVLNGRPIDRQSVMRGASGGAVLGGVTGGLVTKPINALPKEVKGKLGEKLSEADAALRGERLVARQKYVPVGRGANAAGAPGFMRADLKTNRRTIEAKFGPSSSLSARQKQAVKEGFPLHLEQWLPRDIANMLGVGVVQGTAPARRR